MPHPSKPSLESALRHQNRTCPRLRTSSGYVSYSVLDFPTEEMGRFGVGILLYFSLLVRISVVFAIIMLLAMPSLVINIISATTGNAESTANNNLATLSFAGLGNKANQSMIIFPGYGYTPDKELPREVVGLTYACLDVAYSVVFLLFCWYIRNQQFEDAEKVENEVTDESDYTAKVDKLSLDMKSREEFKSFFEEAVGPVHDVVIAFNDGEIILAYKERGILHHKKAAAQVREDFDEIACIEEDIKSLDESIALLEAAFVRAPVAAYISFQKKSDLEYLLKRYPHSWWQRCCVDPKWLFRGSIFFRVERAPNPSNILYHNLAYTPTNQTIRRFLSFIGTLVILFCSFVIIYAAQHYNSQIPSDAACVASVTYAQSVNSSYYLSCYCKQHAGSLFTDTSLRSYCLEWFQAYSLAKGLSIGSSFVIIIVNSVLLILAEKFVEWEKHSSVTNRESAIMIKIFLGMFFNTAIISLLVNADFTSYGGKSFLGGTYADFSPDWYNAVGQSLQITMILNTVNPQILGVIGIPLKLFRIWWYEADCATQKELNDLYAGNHFSLAERYAILLNTVFVTLFYSGGMPVLIVFALCAFIFTNFCDRVALFYTSSIPPKYDDKLAHLTLEILPLSVIIHCGMSLWMYTNPDIASGYPVTAGELSSTGANSYIDSLSADAGTNFAGRILNWNAFPNFLLLCCIILGYALRISYNLLIFFECCRSNKIIPLENELTYAQAVKKFRLSSYRLSDQQEYKEAFKLTDSMKQLKPMNNVGEEDKWMNVKRYGANWVRMESAENKEVSVESAPEYELIELEPPQSPNSLQQSWGYLYDGRARVEIMDQRMLSKLATQYHMMVNNPSNVVRMQCYRCYTIFGVFDPGAECDCICPTCALEFTA